LQRVEYDSNDVVPSYRSSFLEKHQDVICDPLENANASIKASLKFCDAMIANVPVNGIILNPARDGTSKNIIWAPNVKFSPGKSLS
jgi:hypothetical protein